MTEKKKLLKCCEEGTHSFSWRMGIEPCRYCDAPVVQAALASKPEVDVLGFTAEERETIRAEERGLVEDFARKKDGHD